MCWVGYLLSGLGFRSVVLRVLVFFGVGCLFDTCAAWFWIVVEWLRGWVLVSGLVLGWGCICVYGYCGFGVWFV